MGGRLPAFLVIGAVKAATTWLSHQLRRHPLLWLPDAEPHYFSTEYHRGLDWYRSLFEPAPADRIVGEKSADYLAHPDAAARIAAQLPGVPLIVQLRDPVARAYSDYCMLYRRGVVSGDPWRYLDGRHHDSRRFLDGGRYADHIERLFQAMPDARLKILFHEDVVAQPERTIEAVCAHIGVPAHIAPDAIADRRNDSRSELLPLAMRRTLRPLRPVLDPLRSVPVFARVRGAIARPVRYPPLSDELRAVLRAYYTEDVQRLGRLTKRDMTMWSCENRSDRRTPVAAER